MSADQGGAAVVTTDAAAPTAAPAPRSRPRWRALVSALVSVVLVVAIFVYFLPQFADVSAVWRRITDMSGMQVAVLVAAAAWNLLTYLFVMVAVSPGMTYPQAFVLTESTTAVANTVPGGGAVAIGMTYTMYGSWGFSRSRTTTAVVLSGIWNNFAKLGMPILALALLALQGHTTAGRVAAAATGIAALVGAVLLFALILRSQQFAERFGLGAGRVVSRLLALVRRPPVRGWEIATVRFRDRVVGLVRRRWHWLTAATLVSHASLFLVLLVALRDAGVDSSAVAWAEALAAFAFARLVTAIPLTPGGVGFVEVALVAGLVAAGGARTDVVAGVLVYRVLTYVLPIPLGLATYVVWRRKKSWRQARPGVAGAS